MERAKTVFIFALLFCFLLTGCGKETAEDRKESGSGTASGVSGSEPVSDTEMAEDAEAGTGIENYTKYADYDPLRAEPASLAEGENRNILVAYFSRSGNTDIPDGMDAVSSASLNIGEDGSASGNAEQIAEWIAEETGGDLFLIQTEYTYPFDYDDTVEVGEGQDTDGYRPALISHVENMEQYDTVYLVYPIWHYTLSVPVQSFLEEYDLGGKTVYAFATNAGSRFADSVGRIQEAEPEAVVIEGIAVSEREMADAKDMVLKCVRDFNEKPSASDQAEETEDIADMKMNVQIGNASFTAALEDNAATRELAEMMKQGPVSIEMSDYSGFEKVGPLGRSLTTDNHQTTTSAGDIVLYSGDQIVMFYGSNSWSYTRIGKIDDLSGWEEALGSGSITAVFTIAE